LSYAKRKPNKKKKIWHKKKIRLKKIKTQKGRREFFSMGENFPPCTHPPFAVHFAAISSFCGNIRFATTYFATFTL